MGWRSTGWCAGSTIQTGYVPSRKEPLTERQQKHVRTLAPEFNDTRHIEGDGVDGSRRCPGQRVDIVLHLYGADAVD